MGLWRLHDELWPNPLSILRRDIQETAGTAQLCASQILGVESGVHTVHHLFQQEETEAVLLVGTSNAFNCQNHGVALHNVRFLCPYLPQYLSTPTELLSSCSSMVRCCGRKRGQSRVSLWPLPLFFSVIRPLHLFSRFGTLISHYFRIHQ